MHIPKLVPTKVTVPPPLGGALKAPSRGPQGLVEVLVTLYVRVVLGAELFVTVDVFSMVHVTCSYPKQKGKNCSRASAREVKNTVST